MYAGEPKAPALKCSKEQAHGAGSNADWHRDMLQSMMASRFCMVVPGDSQSSERLTDAFVSGAGLALAQMHVLRRSQRAGSYQGHCLGCMRMLAHCKTFIKHIAQARLKPPGANPRRQDALTNLMYMPLTVRPTPMPPCALPCAHVPPHDVGSARQTFPLSSPSWSLALTLAAPPQGAYPCLWDRPSMRCPLRGMWTTRPPRSSST